MAKTYINSPVGVAGWSALNKASTTYVTEGEYCTSLTFNIADQAAASYKEKLEALYMQYVKSLKADGKKPKKGFEIEVDEDTGEFTVKFKQKVYDWMGGKNPIAFFDGAGKPLKKIPAISAGSQLVIRAEVALAMVSGKAFLSLRPKGIQVIELVEAGGASADAMGFTAVEGSYTANVDEDEDENFEGTSESDEDDF